mgnify:FL=1
MVVVVFRSRLVPDLPADYAPMADRMLALARTMPGFVSFKAFEAADGERVSLVGFETAEHAAAWGRHPEHLEAQRHGRERFYAEYHLQIAEVVRERDFER